MTATNLFKSFLTQAEKRCKGCGTISPTARIYVTRAQSWFFLKLVKEETGIDFNSYGKNFSITQKMNIQGYSEFHLDFQRVQSTGGWNVRITPFNQ